MWKSSTFPQDLQRDFYAEMCRVERWSVRTLRQKIASMLFERTALSKKPAELARKELDALRQEDTPTPDLVFRDPYLLTFLGLSDTYSETDLELAILNRRKVPFFPRRTQKNLVLHPIAMNLHWAGFVLAFRRPRGAQLL